MTAPDALLARILDEGQARTRDEAVLAAEVRELRARHERMYRMNVRLLGMVDELEDQLSLRGTIRRLMRKGRR